MSEENQNQRPIPAPEQADPNYKETLLLYNEKNGAVEAVSKLDEQNGRYKVTTTQPLTANKPAFYDLRDYSAAAAFVKGFKSVESNQSFRFLKVAADKAAILLRNSSTSSTTRKTRRGSRRCTSIRLPLINSKRSSSILRILNFRS